MAGVRWSREALAKLELVHAYIAAFDPPAALRIGKSLYDAGESLRDFPNRGRLAADGYRELVTVQPYVLQYRVSGSDVVIVGIRHAAQRQMD